MSWVAAAVGLGSALLGSSSSRSAARAQQQAARDASNTQLAMFEQNREDSAPWRRIGGNALNALAFQLGIPGYDQPEASPDVPEAFDLGNSYQQLRAELLPQFTQRSEIFGAGGDNGTQYADTVDETGLARAIAARLAQQRASRPALPSAPVVDAPGAGYGSLLRDFSAADYQEDPGYQFRVKQGEAAINRNALARGRYNSGSVLRALTDFNSGLASQEYGNAFNRFRSQQGDRFNRLASVAGIGQTATQQVNSDRSALGNALASNAIGAGNAAAAGRIGTANAITGGIGQGINFWQSNQILNMLRDRSNAGVF